MALNTCYLCAAITEKSCWTFANGSLNPDLFFSDNKHLVRKGNLKLAEAIFSSIENCNGVTCNKHKQFLISYKMAVSFKLNNFDFPSLPFSIVSKPVSSVPASLLFATACSSFSYVSALSHKSLSDLANVCDGIVCSSNVYSSKPIGPSKPVCFNSFRPSKPIISKNFYLGKLVCPRNISSSRSFRLSNVGPSKPVRPSKPVPEPICKPVFPTDVIPSQLFCPSNASLSKITHPSNVYSSKPVCPSNDCQSKPVSVKNVCPQNPRFVIKTLTFNLFLVLLFQSILSLA